MEGNMGIVDRELGHTILLGEDIAEVTSMPVKIFGTGVNFLNIAKNFFNWR